MKPAALRKLVRDRLKHKKEFLFHEEPEFSLNLGFATDKMKDYLFINGFQWDEQCVYNQYPMPLLNDIYYTHWQFDHIYDNSEIRKTAEEMNENEIDKETYFWLIFGIQNIRICCPKHHSLPRKNNFSDTMIKKVKKRNIMNVPQEDKGNIRGGRAKSGRAKGGRARGGRARGGRVKEGQTRGGSTKGETSS